MKKIKACVNYIKKNYEVVLASLGVITFILWIIFIALGEQLFVFLTSMALFYISILLAG